MCQENVKNLLFLMFFYWSLLFVNNRTNGISENKQRNYILRIFILRLEFNNQNKYSDQVSRPQLLFCGNYRPLLFEPILVKNDVIFSVKWVIAPQAKIGEVWKLSCKLVLWVYTWIEQPKLHTIYSFRKK